jgi:hypothetical protein
MTESSHAAGMPSGPAIDLAFVRVWFTRHRLAIWFATISGITLLIVPVPWSGMLALGGLAAWALWERQRPIGAIPPGQMARSA